jgi:hypothetical protein
MNSINKELFTKSFLHRVEIMISINNIIFNKNSIKYILTEDYFKNILLYSINIATKNMSAKEYLNKSNELIIEIKLCNETKLIPFNLQKVSEINFDSMKNLNDYFYNTIIDGISD